MNYIKFWEKKLNLLKWQNTPKIILDKNKKIWFSDGKINVYENCILKNDEFLKLSLCGLASLLIFQTFIHIGVNTSLLPTTGMTLPFLSYGGSSLIGSAVLAGIILNYTKIKLDIDE